MNTFYLKNFSVVFEVWVATVIFETECKLVLNNGNLCISLDIQILQKDRHLSFHDHHS